MREKVAGETDFANVHYDKAHWEILQEKREKAKSILMVIPNLTPRVYGSIARGDVTPHSDIDIIIPFSIDEYQLLPVLENFDAEPLLMREVVQATPLAALKAVITLSSEISLTFPLVHLFPREHNFFRFGGSIDLEGLHAKTRVPGVNKKLKLVEPTPEGHIETRITRENASYAAKLLDITIETIYERIRVLERRDKVGRTGIFLKRTLGPDESFSDVLRQIEAMNPSAKRRISREK
ncbi:MAG: DNA polymerase beta domain-containing protein [Promethearchaeota archaeon CR_4]|nr:MAG: DNA polymerase beta domain-containing protein [Candidatus Lokiarchaeota archaeon CR_4]